MRFDQVGSGDVLGWWATEPFQTTDGRLWIGVNAFAPSGVDSVRFLVSGMGATSIAASEHHPARGVRAHWISLEPAQVSGDSVSVTATVIPNGTEQPLESPPKQIRKRGARWDVETFKDGWTHLKPSSDSRLIYVSNAGDDAAAASAKGRGYYLPSDPEIGPDPTNPVGPIVAYRNPQQGLKKLRGNGAPEWVLFRRGDSYSDAILDSGDPYWSGGGPSFRLAGIWRWAWTGSRFGYEAGSLCGRSAEEPFVVTAWGPIADARPIFTGGMGIPFTFGHSVIASLDLQGRAGFEFGAEDRESVRPWENVLIEDCRAEGHSGIAVSGGSSATSITLRRCVSTGSWSSGAHNQGFYCYLPPSRVVIEECLFDRNGFKEDPNVAATWTAGVVSGQVVGSLPAGTGVQPTRTYFDRNLYLAAYDSMTLRGNIISRDGGGSSVQMRQGGVAERNLFIWNEMALSSVQSQADTTGHKGTLLKDNVVLHDDHLLPPGGWGVGIDAGGADDDLAVLDGNIVAHFHRGNNGFSSLGLSGKPYYSADWPASQLMRGIVKDNAVYREYGGVGIMVNATTHDHGVLDAVVTGNAVSTSSQLSMQGNSSKPAGFVYGGNKFHSATGSGLFRWGWESNSNGDYRYAPFTDGTFSQWQSAGFDTDGTFTTDFASFKAAAGWTAPERDIVSYMQSVDPTYVVNEDVYVDEESSVKQSVRQKVWEVLSDPAKAGSLVMSAERAKQVARRYHAFITFIQRAKANRKGAWDTRWTAEAVNNYIREGFGKAPVTGPYQTTLSDLANYTPITP